MSLRSMKNITRRSWYIIPIPDTVIDWVNLLGKYQQYLLVFTYCKGRIIGDGDVKLTGVNRYGYENEAPLKNKNENYLDYQEYKQEVHPDHEYQTIIQQTIK